VKIVSSSHAHASPLLSKDDPMKNQTLLAVVPFFAILFILWLLYFARKDLFADKSIPYIILVGFTFSVTSVSMHTLNKAVVSFTHQPSTVTSIQMIIAVVTLMCWHGKEVISADRTQMFKWCLVPVAYAAMLNTSLLGYEYLTLTLVTVFRNLAPLVTMLVEGVIMPPEHQPTVTLPIIASIATMIVGALLFSWTESAFSWLGLFLVLLNTLLAILDRVLQRRLLVEECKDLPLSACMVINNSLGVLPTILIAGLSKEFQGFQDSATNWKDPGVITLVIMSGFMGLFIGLSGLMCQKAMSATSFQVLQNMSKVVVVVIGVQIFGDKIDSTMRIVGMILSLGGSMAYGYAQARERMKQGDQIKQGELKPLVKGSQKV